MTRGGFKKHSRLVAKYKHPTNDMIDKINLCVDDIISIHFELPLKKLFDDYGCLSDKTPDIIYRTFKDHDDFYYIGEIKSGTHLKAKARAHDKSQIYSEILSNYGIPHTSFIVTGYTGLAEISKIKPKNLLFKKTKCKHKYKINYKHHNKRS